MVNLTKESAIIKNYARLVKEGKRSIESIKDFTIRKLVMDALKSK